MFVYPTVGFIGSEIRMKIGINLSKNLWKMTYLGI